MNKLKMKFGLMSVSITFFNWLLINFLIIEIYFFKYLLIESIWALSFFIFEKERKRIKEKHIN